MLWDVARIVHEADLDDGRYDTPEAPGLDALIRGLSFVRGDLELLTVADPLFDGLYEYRKQALLSGRPSLHNLPEEHRLPVLGGSAEGAA